MPRDVAVSRGATRGLSSELESSGPALDKATSPLSPVSPRSGHLGPQLGLSQPAKLGNFSGVGVGGNSQHSGGIALGY